MLFFHQRKASCTQVPWTTKPFKCVRVKVYPSASAWRPIQSRAPSLGASWAAGCATQLTTSSPHTAMITRKTTHSALLPSGRNCSLASLGGIRSLYFAAKRRHESCSCHCCVTNAAVVLKVPQGFLWNRNSPNLNTFHWKKSICGITVVPHIIICLSQCHGVCL